jgi:anti-sigma factor RsiW
VSCRELVELVTAYFEGTLSWRQRRRFEKHIAGCQWCTRYLEQMETTIRVVGRIDEESISPEARDALLGAFSDWTGGAPLPREPQG